MNKQIAVIMLLIMTVFLGFGVIIPVLPIMVSGSGEASYHMAWLLSIYSAASFLMSPVWGKWSDRIGRRPIILIGLLGFSASFFLFGMAEENIMLMYVSRIIGGLFSGAVASCAVAYVADITTEENRTKGMGLVGMSIGLGFIFGPALGGLLSFYGIGVPFFASAILSLVGFVFAARYLKESLPADRRSKSTEVRQSRLKAFAGTLKYLYVLSFLVSFTLAGLETIFQYFQILRIGASTVDIGIMFFVSGVVGALVQGGVVRRWIKKDGEKTAIWVGLLLSSVGFFLILFSNSVLTATIYLSIFFAGNALIRPCVISLITTRTKVGQGVATGLNSSMDSLGRILGPQLAMWLYIFRESLPFLISGLLCVAAIGLLIRFVVLDKQQRGENKEAVNL